MKNNTKENPIVDFIKTVLLDKKTILVVEILLCAVFGVLFGLGIYYSNLFLEGFCSNCFTAFLVSLLSTIIKWKHEEGEEKAAKYMEEKLLKSDEYNGQLTQHIQSLSNQIDTLSSALTIYKGKECIFCKSYVKGVKLNREQCKLHDFFANANREISILVINLRSLMGFTDDLCSAAQRGVKVRILTMHPDFAVDFINTRAVDTMSNKERWLSMRQSLDWFLSEAVPTENFQVHAYKGISPTLILFIADDKCYVAHLLNGQETAKSAHYLFGDETNEGAKDSSNNGVSPVDSFKKHFEYVWADNGTKYYPLAEIKSLKMPPEYQE